MKTRNRLNQARRFKSTSEGLFIVNGNSRRRIADYIQVKGFAIEEGGTDYLAVVGFLNLDGKRDEMIVPRKDLFKHGAITERLASAGYTLPEGTKLRALVHYLRSAQPPRRMLITQRMGWVNGRFVYEEKVVGKGDQRIIYEPLVRHREDGPPTSGTLAEWIEAVARPATHSSRMMFGISLALAASLLEMTRAESGGFHLYDSESSKGKSTVLLAANSVHGSGRREDLLHWDVTDARLDELAAEHCDRVLALDEVARLADDPKIAAVRARKASFKLASGRGKLRSIYFGKRGNECRWRTILLSSGETGIFELANAAGSGRLQGDKVRFIDVPAVVNRKLGIFETVPSGTHPRDLVDQIAAACAQFYGKAGRAFVRKVRRRRRDAGRWIAEARAEFERLAEVPTDGWERRFARIPSLAYAAAMLGIKFGILPWTPEQVAAAVISCYRDARRAVPDFDRLVSDAMKTMRRKLRKGSRVRDLRQNARQSGQPSVNKAVAFLKQDDQHGLFYAIKPAALQRWIGDKVSPRMVAERLLQKGVLITGKRGVLTKQVMIPGIAQKRRYFCVSASYVTG